MQGFPPHGGYGMPPQQIPPGYAQPGYAQPGYPPQGYGVNPYPQQVIPQAGFAQVAYAQQQYTNPMAAYTYDNYGSRVNIQQIDSDCQSLRKAMKGLGTDEDLITVKDSGV